jgi:hypothetical protein
MQFASFDIRDPVFDVLGMRLSLQVVTLENLYGVDPGSVEIRRSGDRVNVRAARLRWGGQQESASGEIELTASREGADRVRLVVRTRAPEPVRCTKILLRDLDTPLAVVDAEGEAREVLTHGELATYPPGLPTPLFLLRAGERVIGARAEDDRVREKRFAASVERFGELRGRGVLELIHEEDASKFSEATECPPFVVGRDVDARAFESEHVAWLERRFGLVPFAERTDVPPWARDLALVVTLHGMHWTGRVFLDYAAMLEVLEFVASRVAPGRVLAYLPGWEGRYYWQYGDYRPEPRLGGEAGFARLCEGARSLGVHLMPMFGANCANLELPAYRDLDDSLFLKSAARCRFHGNRPDWDLSRSHDPGWQGWLNPGHPEWRERLAGQIEGLHDSFDFDGVFLDTTEIWTNDPDHAVHDGLRALVERLRSSLPDVLLAAEYDYDALIPLFPLFQRAWWTRAPAWTARYVKRFGHLCEGEPEGRTGVHELGSFRAGAVPAGDGLLATIAFQDGTLERSRAEVETALRAVREGIR